MAGKDYQGRLQEAGVPCILVAFASFDWSGLDGIQLEVLVPLLKKRLFGLGLGLTPYIQDPESWHMEGMQTDTRPGYDVQQP